MRLDFCPRRDLVARLHAGYRLIPGHDYRPDDWAILVMLPDVPEPMSAAEIHDMARPFMPAFREPNDNRTAGALSAASRNLSDSAALAERRPRDAERKREGRKAEREARDREFIRRKLETA